MVGTAIAALLTTVLGLLALTPGVAHADNEVISSTPEDGATLQTSPTEIVINFTEEVGDLRIVSLTCETELFTLDRPTLSGNLRIMTVPITEQLPKGVCVISWRVADVDGAPNGDGLISFNVENEPIATTTVEAGVATTPTTHKKIGALVT